MKPITIFALCLAVTIIQAQKLSLNDALTRAAENRPLVKSAKLLVEQSKLTSRALGAYAPTVLGAGASSRREVGATDGDLFLSQPVDIFGRTTAGRRAGRATVKTAEASFRASLLGLQSDVLEAYFQTVAATELSQSADEVLQVAEGLTKATQRRFEEGKIPEVQVTRASIEFERAKQTSLLRKAARDASLKRLAGALGSGSPAIDLDLSASLDPVAKPDIELRPDLLQLNAAIEEAEADVALARVSRMPELEVQARRSPWNDSQVFYGGRIQLTWSFFDHGRSRFESDAAKKRSASSRALLEDAKGRARAEIAAVQVELDAAREQVASYLRIIESARSLVAKTQLGFSEGAGTQIDVLEANRALRGVEQELAEARLRMNLAVVAQYKASGQLMEVLK